MPKPIVLDFETSIGTHKYHEASRDVTNDIYTMIHGDHPERISVLHKENGFNRTLPEGFLEGFDLLVGANLSFDLGYIWKDEQWQEFLYNENNSIWDVQQAEYILSGQRHKYASLAELQEIYLGQKTKEDRISKLFKAGIGADRIIKAKSRTPRLFKVYEFYCFGDGSSTLKIFAQQYRRAKKEGCLKLIKTRMKGLLADIMMENTGINIHVTRCEKTLRDFKLKSMDYLSQAEEFVKPLWDDRLHNFSINSPKDKSAVLFGGDFYVPKKIEDGLYKNGNQKYKTVQELVHIEGFGLSTHYSIEGATVGQWGTGADVINKIYKECKNEKAIEYCKLQKLAMKYSKMASTYLEPFLNYSVNGILYPNYNTTQTETGRLSSSKPNMQNPPASGEMLLAIQGQMVAPEGWSCVSIDFSQLEPFVTALITGDTSLANDLLTGTCSHCRAVSWIPRMSEGKTYDEIYHLAKVLQDPKWVLKRKKAKAINFKRAYGGGAKSLAEAEDLDIEDVKAVFESQDLAYPKVKEFNDRLYASLPQNQQLSRRIHFSATDAKGRKFHHGIELLPIYDGKGQKQYIDEEYRHFGTYVNRFGHKFCFEEFGHIDKWGRIKRRYSTTETRNYQVQGTATDVVTMATADVMYLSLIHI